MMTPAAEYEAGLRELHRLIAGGADETEAGERNRDRSDALWRLLTPGERQAMRRLSASLYEEQVSGSE